MLKDIKYRWAVILFIIISAAYLLWPTYKLYSLTETEKEEAGINIIKELKEGAINLGLDLQGGMYVLLEADIPTLVEKLASKRSFELKEAILEADTRSINKRSDFFTEFLAVANAQDIRLVRFYTNLATRRDNESVVEELKIQRNNAIASALEIIRNRIDEFGVSEPTIQKYGANRIIVELAGIKDSNRARNLIQRTASLEFTLVLNDKWETVLEKLDTYLLSDTSIAGVLNESKTDTTSSDSELDIDAEDIFIEENIVDGPSIDPSTPESVLKEGGILKLDIDTSI